MSDIKEERVIDLSPNKDPALNGLIELFSKRQKSMAATVKCHETLESLYWWLYYGGAALVLALQLVSTMMITFAPDRQSANTAITAVALFITATSKKLDFSTTYNAHKIAKIAAQSLASQMEYELLRRGQTMESLTSIFNTYAEKIETFRHTEETVPVWVKERYMTWAINGG